MSACFGSLSDDKRACPSSSAATLGIAIGIGIEREQTPNPGSETDDICPEDLTVCANGTNDPDFDFDTESILQSAAIREIGGLLSRREEFSFPSPSTFAKAPADRSVPLPEYSWKGQSLREREG
jgi:hypothetical protein